MQFPIDIGLRRSFLLLGFVLALHVLALAVLPFMPWPTWLQGLAGLSVVLALGVAIWQWSQLPPPLRIAPTGCLLWSDDQETWGLASVQLRWCHPRLTVFSATMAGRRHHYVVLPDSLEAATFRRLRVWLRWCGSSDA